MEFEKGITKIEPQKGISALPGNSAGDCPVMFVESMKREFKIPEYVNNHDNTPMLNQTSHHNCE